MVVLPPIFSNLKSGTATSGACKSCGQLRKALDEGASSASAGAKGCHQGAHPSGQVQHSAWRAGVDARHVLTSGRTALTQQAKPGSALGVKDMLWIVDVD